MFGWLRTAAIAGAGIWIGIMACVGFVVAPYLFGLAAQKSAVVPHTGAAGELIGPLLHQVDRISLTAAAGLFAALLVLRRGASRPWGARYWAAEAGTIVAAVCAAVNYWKLSPALGAVKAQLAEKYGAYHLSDKSDALYKQFGGLHGMSTLLFVTGMLGAAVALVCLTQFRPLGGAAEVR